MYDIDINLDIMYVITVVTVKFRLVYKWKVFKSTKKNFNSPKTKRVPGTYEYLICYDTKCLAPLLFNKLLYKNDRLFWKRHIQSEN